MKKFKESIYGPPMILALICLVVTLLLAVTNQKTEAVISAREASEALVAQREVLPNAEDFEEISDVDLPEGVEKAYSTSNQVGYAFQAGAKGYGGVVTLMVGMDLDGNVVGISVLDQSETPGLGSRALEAEYLAKYYNNDVSQVEIVTGATLTSTAVQNTLKSCQEAYELVAE